MAPQAFDGPLGAVSLAAAVDTILHLECLDLLIGQMVEAFAMGKGCGQGFLIGLP